MRRRVILLYGYKHLGRIPCLFLLGRTPHGDVTDIFIYGRYANYRICAEQIKIINTKMRISVNKIMQ